MKKSYFRVVILSTFICLLSIMQAFSQEDLNFDLPDASVFDVPASSTSTPADQNNTTPAEPTQSNNVTTPAVTQPTVTEESNKVDEPVQDVPVQSSEIPSFEQPTNNTSVVPAEVKNEPIPEKTAVSSSTPVSTPSPVLSDNSKPWIQRGWGINASFGSNLFYGDLRIYDLWPAKQYNNERKWAGALSLEKELVPSLDWRGQILYGTLSGTKRKYSSGEPANLYFDATVLETNTNIKFNIVNAILGHEALFSVYGYAGMGFTIFRTQRKDLRTDAVIQSFGYDGAKKSTPTIETMVPMGLGFEFKATPNLFFDLDVSMRVVNTDKLDGFVTDNNSTLLQDMYGYTSIGVTYKFGDRSNPKLQEEVAVVAPVIPAAVDTTEKVDTLAKADSVVNTEIPVVVETIDSTAIKAAEEAEAQRLKDLQMQSELVINTPSPIVEKPTSQTPTPTVVDGVAYQNVDVDQGLVYRIQIIAVKVQKDSKVSQLQKIYKLQEVIYEEKVDGWYKYTVGSFTTLDQALAYRLVLVNKGIKDAFIVPYYQGKRITNQQARELLSK